MTPSGFQSVFRVFLNNMSSSPSVLLPPVGVRGMKDLDREKFLRIVRVPILKISEQFLSKVSPLCKPYLLKVENFKPVQNLHERNYEKCIYLSPDKVNSWDDIPEDVREGFCRHGVSEANFDTEEVHFRYENWKFEEIFKAVLPENEEIVSSFSQIGHIIHLNLREHLLDYRPLIGQVLLDKIKTCRTVVNKNNIIDNTYRNFSMDIIAGQENFLVTVKENRCNFQFDFSKVYWNPRLCKEHERILGFLRAGDVLFDVFCGVGPFSIPAAKRKCKVYANDLNPDSYKWLNHNATSNKVKDTLFKSYNLDGKDFICGIFRNYLIDYTEGNEKIEDGGKICVTMNLPAMAVEFLKHFHGLIVDKQVLDKLDMEIIVYVYCFAIGEDPVLGAKEMVNANIGCDISSEILDVFDVRNVSPKKEMMRVSFRLTRDILAGVKNQKEEPPIKKLCVGD